MNEIHRKIRENTPVQLEIKQEYVFRNEKLREHEY